MQNDYDETLGQNGDEDEDVTTGSTVDASAPTVAGEAAAAEEPTDETPIDYAIKAEAVSGVIQGLASTIPPKGTPLLAIANPSDGEIPVTVVPAAAKDETESAIPLGVKGPPAEIDTEFVKALSV